MAIKLTNLIENDDYRLHDTLHIDMNTNTVWIIETIINKELSNNNSKENIKKLIYLALKEKHSKDLDEMKRNRIQKLLDEFLPKSECVDYETYKQIKKLLNDAVTIDIDIDFTSKEIPMFIYPYQTYEYLASNHTIIKERTIALNKRQPPINTPDHIIKLYLSQNNDDEFIQSIKENITRIDLWLLERSYRIENIITNKMSVNDILDFYTDGFTIEKGSNLINVTSYSVNYYSYLAKTKYDMKVSSSESTISYQTDRYDDLDIYTKLYFDKNFHEYNE